MGLSMSTSSIVSGWCGPWKMAALMLRSSPGSRSIPAPPSPIGAAPGIDDGLPADRDAAPLAGAAVGGRAGVTRGRVRLQEVRLGEPVEMRAAHEDLRGGLA